VAHAGSASCTPSVVVAPSSRWLTAPALTDGLACCGFVAACCCRPWTELACHQAACPPAHGGSPYGKHRTASVACCPCAAGAGKDACLVYYGTAQGGLPPLATAARVQTTSPALHMPSKATGTSPALHMPSKATGAALDRHFLLCSGLERS
jgi:hypothetical protein